MKPQILTVQSLRLASTASAPAYAHRNPILPPAIADESTFTLQHIEVLDSTIAYVDEGGAMGPNPHFNTIRLMRMHGVSPLVSSTDA